MSLLLLSAKIQDQHQKQLIEDDSEGLQAFEHWTMSLLIRDDFVWLIDDVVVQGMDRSSPDDEYLTFMVHLHHAIVV